jgi:hypothetical protein
LTFTAEDLTTWRPLSRAEFGQLQRGQHLRERRGREWTVFVAPHQRGDGYVKVVIRSGDLVRHVDERFADDYMLAEDGAGG